MRRVCFSTLEELIHKLNKRTDFQNFDQIFLNFLLASGSRSLHIDKLLQFILHRNNKAKSFFNNLQSCPNSGGPWSIVKNFRQMMDATWIFPYTCRTRLNFDLINRSKRKEWCYVRITLLLIRLICKNLAFRIFHLWARFCQQIN